MNIKKNIFLLIGLSFIIRLISTIFFHDNQIDNEWGILLDNLIKHKTYSFYNYEDTLIPSVLMPPLYAYFLYCIKILTFGKISFLNTLIFIQIIFSTISVYIFYKINEKLFSNNICLINSYIFSLLPLNIYAAGQTSSITLQIFLLLLFLLFVLILIKNQTKKNFIIFSLISSFSILIRGEFILIYAMTLLYFLLQKKIKIISLILIIFLTFVFVSPYLIRNYITFNQVILVKSLGYNLWKGNNEFSSVEGYADINNQSFKNLKQNVDSLNKDNFYEFKRDNIFFSEAIKNLTENPINYTKLFFKKMLAFYLIDLGSTYPNYYNIFHFVPVLVIGILSIPGLLLNLRKDDLQIKYLKIYLFKTIIIFSVFFILPRYKLTILPIQIILVTYFLEHIFIKLKKNVFKI